MTRRRNEMLKNAKSTMSETQPGFHEYFAAQKRNLCNTLEFPPFAVLLPIVHDLYVMTARLVPTDNQFAPFVLIGDKEFLAAASLIGQAQPDEAAPITRRAIEMARAVAAFKKDSENIKKWTAFPERIARWSRYRAQEAAGRPVYRSGPISAHGRIEQRGSKPEEGEGKVKVAQQHEWIEFPFTFAGRPAANQLHPSEKAQIPSTRVVDGRTAHGESSGSAELVLREKSAGTPARRV